jgi:hypothetical protein
MAKDVVSQPQNVEKSIGAPAQTAQAMANDSQPSAGQGKTNFAQIEGQTKSLVIAGTLPALLLQDSDAKAGTTGTKIDATGTKTDATGAKTDATGAKTTATGATEANSASSIADDGRPLNSAQVAAEATKLEPMVKQFMNSTDVATQKQALNSYQAEVANVVSHGTTSTNQVFNSLSGILNTDPQMNAYVNPKYYTDGTPAMDVENKTLNENKLETTLFTAVGNSSIITNGTDGSAYTFNRTTALVNGKPGATTPTDKGTKAPSSSNGAGGGYDSPAPAPAAAQASPYVQLSNGQIGYDNGITTSWTNGTGIHTGIDGQQ